MSVMLIQILYIFEPNDDANPLTNSTIIISATNETTLYYTRLTDLKHCTEYHISVMASTSLELGTAAEVSVMTSTNSGTLNNISAACTINELD